MPARRSPGTPSRPQEASTADDGRRRTGLRRRRPPDRTARPHHLVVSSVDTTSLSGARTTGERCAAPNAASGRPASSTRATSTTRPPSAAAASARPARCGSRPTSGSRPPGSSSSSATASRQEFDRDRLASGLRKALTRRPVPDGAAEAAADAIEAELRAAGVTEVPSSRDRRAGDGAAPRHRPDRLHPLRQRLPELRGPRGAQARGRHPVRRARRHVASTCARSAAGSRDERPVRPRHPGGARGGRASGSTRTTRATSSRRRSTSTSTAASGSSATTATPFIDVRAPQPDLTELLTIDDDEPFILHPGRVRPRPDARMGRAAGRPRRQARGQSLVWAGSACSSTRPRATWTRAGRAT